MQSIQYDKEFVWAKIFGFFGIASLITRTVFLIRERSEIDFSLIIIAKIYLFGLFFDLITLTYFSFIPLLYYILVPNKIFTKKSHLYFVLLLYFIFIYGIIFNVAAEWFFWDEFSSRYNFIAVDYLIYTSEVIGNIVESYPVGWLMSFMVLIATSIFFFSYKNILKNIEKKINFRERLQFSIAPLLICVIAFFTVDSGRIAGKISDNNYVQEISYNGIYQLFSAYRNNQIDFDKFYLNQDSQNYSIEKSTSEIKQDIANQNPDIKFLNQDTTQFTYHVPKKTNEAEKKYNVIFVTVESLSAEYLTAFGNKDGITPNLDKIANQSLFFTNLIATGNRTVRGLEALALSVPPTPGNSIVRRPNNENLFTIGKPFQNRGYDTKFIYGGHGYFDNMNYFYHNNGFQTIDRNNFTKDEISFSNVWGVSDEDLFSKTIKEADKSYENGKPFFSILMTTSNHRPFTYPEGRIDIPSKSNRDGAVKYTDYAIGKLIEDSKKKPWFKNTIFVIIADHCAGSAGNTDLPFWRYQIPAIFYAPDIIKPRKFNKLISQIDIAPTLLGLLNFDYNSNFFGNDVIRNEKYIKERAFFGTYEKIGYFIDNKLYVLLPKKLYKIFDVKINNFGWNGSQETITKEFDQQHFNESIDYYRVANHLFNAGLLKNNVEHHKN